MAMKSSSVMLVALCLFAAMAASAPKAEAQLLTGVVQVTGIVNCTVNVTSGAPPFPNANVALQCLGVTLGTAITNSTGGFTISVRLTPTVATLLSSLTCRVVVTTPLASCNATLPAVGGLVSPIQFTGITLGSILSPVLTFAANALTYVLNLPLL